MQHYTTSAGQKFVAAKARIVPPRGYQTSAGIVVDQCPYCLHTHRHGFVEDVGGIFGLREADCGKGEYMLVDAAKFETLVSE